MYPAEYLLDRRGGRHLKHENEMLYCLNMRRDLYLAFNINNWKNYWKLEMLNCLESDIVNVNVELFYQDLALMLNTRTIYWKEIMETFVKIFFV